MTARRVLLAAPDGRTYLVPEDRLEPFHILEILDASWRLTHPITCDLPECPFDDVARGWDGPPYLPGTYRWLSYHERPLPIVGPPLRRKQ